MEKWQTIPGFSLYKASTMGKIKTFNWKNHGLERVMKPALDDSGYLRTMLKSDKGITATIKVHRIMLITFKGEPPEGKNITNHINGIRSDNRIENLEWVSSSENAIHSFRIGLSSNKGQNNPASTLTDEQVLEIRKNYTYGKKARSGVTKKEIAEQYGTTFSVIKAITQGRTWKHLL